MIDTYTKAILTVIAGALIALVIQNSVRPATANEPPCGRVRNPCYVTSTGDDPITVVNSPRSPIFTQSFSGR
jgi:hypothetical protein